MMSNSIFKTSDILNIRIQTIQQRIRKLETDKQNGSCSHFEEQELTKLYAKLQPLSKRLSEVHQLILDYSVKINSETERIIVIEYFVNHTPRPTIAMNEFYDRSWVYKIVKKYLNL